MAKSIHIKRLSPSSLVCIYFQKYLDSNDLESLDLADPDSEYGLIHQVLGNQSPRPQAQGKHNLHAVLYI